MSERISFPCKGQECLGQPCLLGMDLDINKLQCHVHKFKLGSNERMNMSFAMSKVP